MDKLKPLLAHKFWVLFGLVLLLPFVAWWMTSGSLKAETTTKTTEIKTAESQVPTTDSPNDKHVSGAKSIVDQKEVAVREQIQRLWDRQQSLMTWPRQLQADMKKYVYRDEIDSVYRVRYPVQYPAERARIEAVARPFNPNSLREEGLVSLEGLPFIDSALEWRSRPPTSEQMWDTQEDNWLIESILRAINEVNKTDATGKPPTDITSAPIPQVTLLLLKGGTPGPLGGTATTPGATDDDGGSTAGNAPTGDLFGAAGSRGGGDGGDGGGSTVGAAVSFDPAEVFGSAALATATADGESTESYDEGAGRGLLGGGPRGPVEKRYIEDDPSLPYRTRGFYLEVTMRNEFLPDLLLSLSNMDWPTSISRVQMAERYADEVEYLNAVTGTRDGGGSEDGNFGRPRLGGRPLFRPPVQFGRTNTTDGGTGRSSLLEAALQNRALANVAIAGVITIYNPPTLEPVPETPTETTPGLTETPSPIDPAVTDPALTDPANADPALGDPAAEGLEPTTDGPPAGEPVEIPPVPADSTGTPAETESSNPETPPDGGDAEPRPNLP